MTPNTSTLPIPEQTIVGSGSYVIPANRYGFMSMSASVGAASGTNSASSSNSYAGGAGGSGSANNNTQWLIAGDSITVSTSFPSFNTTGNNFSAVFPFGRININGVAVCIAYSGSGAGSNTATSKQGSSAGQVGWSVSLFRIPKANLPDGAAEGES